MLKVPDDIKRDLIRKPEYFMGFQKVAVCLSSSQYEEGYVFNGALYGQPWEFINADLAHNYDGILFNAAGSSVRILSATNIVRSQASLKNVRQIRKSAGEVVILSGSVTNAAPAKDAPITSTIAGEEFKRFSAYIDDNRVTPGKGLTPGTFATTAEDAKNVRTGTEAVARYSLPNKTPASWRFTIFPRPSTKLQRGTVEPAFGEPGGGIEVIFVDGTHDGTVTGPDKLPDK